MKHRGVICDSAGRRVTLSKVRRERLGTSSWLRLLARLFFKGLPSRIGYLLDISMRYLERILYFEGYVVIDTGDVPGIKEREMLPRKKYRELQKDFAGQFARRWARKPSRELLKRVEVEKLSERCAKDEGRPEPAEAHQVRRSA